MYEASHLPLLDQLFYAASCDLAADVAALTPRVEDLDAPTELGNTVLHIASARGYVDVVKVLLEAGASVDSFDNQERTPLSVAAAGGHASTVQMLLNAGADANARDKQGLSPFHHAIANNHAPVVAALEQVVVERLVRGNPALRRLQ